MSLYQTYRPAKFSEVTGQGHVITALQQQIQSDRVGHAYLFTGPRGVGKTTTARLLAAAVNCDKRSGAEACGECAACAALKARATLDVIEIDAASHTSVEHVREHIIENVRFAPTQLQRKVFIIDEVHMLSKSAFNALLKTLEEPPTYALFILATTELHKIPATIISRCQRFDFGTIPVEEMITRLAGIAKKEKVEVDDAVLRDVARRSEGCLRDAESLLDQLIALSVERITPEEAARVLPSVDVDASLQILEALVARDAATALRAIHTLHVSGVQMRPLVEQLVAIVRHSLLARAGSTELPAIYTADQAKRVTAALGEVELGTLRMLLESLLQAERELSRYSISQISLELAVLDVCGAAPVAVTAATAPVQAATPAPAPSPVTEVKEGPGAKGVVKEVAVNEVTEAPAQQEETPAAPPAAAPGQAATTLDAVQKYWTTFQKALKAKHASLPLALEQGVPVAVEEERVIVELPFAFYADTVNELKNNTLLSTILSEVLSAQVKLEGRFAGAEQDAAVSDVINAFGGEVVAEGV